MNTLSKKYLTVAAVFAAVAVLGSASLFYLGSAEAAPQGGKIVVPLKEAKLNIEHNATALDTGFQGAVDSEGWKSLTFTGPEGKVLTITGLGELGKLGLTELFFETVEPENVDVSIADMLEVLPEGNYNIDGPGIEYGEATGLTAGTAWLTHDIPAGAVLLLPAEGSVVPTDEDLLMDWAPVTETITGAAVEIISYQLIVERISDPQPHMIGKISSFSMYLPASVTSMRVPKEFLEPEVEYDWEVLAIEESGNQTLSSGTFSTE